MDRRRFLKQIVAVGGGTVVGVPKAKKIKRVNMDVPGQKYQAGDRVHITKDMPSCMSHFHKGVDATVMYSDVERYVSRARYGNKHEDWREGESQYCLDVDGHGEVSWYYEHQLTPIYE